MQPSSYLLGANLRVLSTSYVLPETKKNIDNAVSYWFIWRPQGDLNACCRRERPVSWTRLDDGDVIFGRDYRAKRMGWRIIVLALYPLHIRHAFCLVGRAGLEPATLCLKGRYSTDWVNGPLEIYFLITFFINVNKNSEYFDYFRQNSGTIRIITVNISSLPSNIHQMSSHFPRKGIWA